VTLRLRLVRFVVSKVSLLAELRQATASLHADVETGSDIEARLHDIRSRPEMVAAFYAFHLGVEEGLRAHAAALANAGWRLAHRAALIGEEAEALGARLPSTVPTPGIASLSEAFGWIYVVEGSTLGGRIIRRRLSAAEVSLAGLAFLDPWGEATGSRWRTLTAVLERSAGDERVRSDLVVEGACAAFAFAGRRLAPVHFAEPA
jgi:heme oxygenase